MALKTPETCKCYAKFYVLNGDPQIVHEELLKKCESYYAGERKRLERDKCIDFLATFTNADYSPFSHLGLLNTIKDVINKELALLAIKREEDKSLEVLHIDGTAKCSQCGFPTELRKPFGEICTNKSCNKIQIEKDKNSLME